ncbi:MAG: component of SufBCD complex [Paracoccaceae bacterium]|nr:component of SufBCD complex [Paracoccaceae bacterium]
MGLQPGWYQRIYELLDLRSFSNLWYWLAVAVVWSSASHFVVGVPYDMVLRARRRGGQAESDLDSLAQIHANRIVSAEESAGAWIVGVMSFWLTVLGLLGFHYGIEFAQAVFLIVAPLTPVGYVTLRSARTIAGQSLGGVALQRQIARTRLAIQVIGFFALFVTALWGMYQNLLLGGLRG